MVQPQLHLSAGGLGTLGLLRIEMRLGWGACSCRHASQPGRKKSTPVTGYPLQITFQPCDSNSVMNTLSTPVSLYSTRRKEYALPVDPRQWSSFRTWALTLLGEWPMSPV
jgi:hypothetical protein